tara:strand:- start:2128 stop:2685 length:558 start_codon:yes stop_codon:yes gene_type:complete
MLKHVVNNIKIKKVVLIPTYLSPQKSTGLLTAQQRYDCLQQISHLYPGSNKGIDYECLDYEIKQKKPVYSIDTINMMCDTYNNNNIMLLLGSDQLFNFHTWKEYQQIVKMVDICVVKRDAYPISTYMEYLKKYIYTLDSKHIIILNNPVFNVSSTDIRSKLTDKSYLSKTMPQEVMNYLIKNNDK